MSILARPALTPGLPPLPAAEGSLSLHTFSSESVSEGHPDKVCDGIADHILNAHLAQDPDARVACEVLASGNRVVLAGEITSRAVVDHAAVAREAVRAIGYTHAEEPFCADDLEIHCWIGRQSEEIARGVHAATRPSGEQGAGDQGIMFGYATDETPEQMPLPILLAHRLSRALARHRKEGGVAWLRPDAKTQVSVRYDGAVPVEVSDVVVSTQHAAGTEPETVRHFVRDTLLPEELGDWHHDAIRVRVNPAGTFVRGGPAADAGVTGRKIIVDTYGGMGRHGGGAFSGKDASKVDRSGAYFCRFVARRLLAEGLARRAEVQVAYAIGEARPVSVRVDTFGTGDARLAEAFVRERFDFRPAAMIERLGLKRPFYRLDHPLRALRTRGAAVGGVRGKEGPPGRSWSWPQLRVRKRAWHGRAGVSPCVGIAHGDSEQYRGSGVPTDRHGG